MLAGRRLMWLPWALVVLALTIAVTEGIVSLQNSQITHHRVSIWDVLVAIEVGIPPLTFTGVGAFIATRRPGNRIAWLMIAIGLSYGLAILTSDYPGIYGRSDHATRPLGTVVAWYSDWGGPLYLIALQAYFLLFPTGQLSSRRWRMVLWLGIGPWGGVSLVTAITRGPVNETRMQNPFGLIAVPQEVIGLLLVGGLIALAISLFSPIIRFRSARGDVRQQLKWFIYGDVLVITFVLVGFLTGWSNGFALLAVASLAIMPILMGVAILRYRLYEIDVLINRTLVYLALSASLAAIYIGGVVLLQALFRLVSGQGSTLAIALSTLAVAALFGPLRRNIQIAIDRRFYRRKYDAARTLAVLSRQLSDETNLEQISTAVITVLGETMQPERASLVLLARGEKTVER